MAGRPPADDAWILDTSGLGHAEVRVSVSAEGRITDWGPSGGPGHLASATAALGPDERDLRIVFRDDPGLFYVATWPPGAPVRIDVDRGSAAPPTSFVGRLQLPLDILGRLVDPRERSDLWVAAAEPGRPPSVGPSLRVWRQPYREPKATASSRALNELDRVLREWGYIR